MQLQEKYSLGGLEMDSPIIASASSATARLPDLIQLNRTAIGAITIKSATLEARAGNPETNYFDDQNLTVNAMGLPGPDIDGTMRMLEDFHRSGRQKPLILSIVGFKPGEFQQIVKAVKGQIGTLFDSIEANFSCPNVAGKPIVSYDPKTMEQITAEILAETPGIHLGIKLAPFFSEEVQMTLHAQINQELEPLGLRVVFENSTFYARPALQDTARSLNRLCHRGLRYITQTNTFPNCKIYDQHGRTVLNPEANQGRGGMSGYYLHGISLDNVRQMRPLINRELQIIGVGGVKDGYTAENFFIAGAEFVGIGTALLQRGPSVVQKILLDLISR